MRRAEGADQFRTRLAAAVKARDIDGAVALAADDVKLDFGGGEGSAELRTRLADELLGLWDELDALMALGCSANEQAASPSRGSSTRTSAKPIPILPCW